MSGVQTVSVSLKNFRLVHHFRAIRLTGGVDPGQDTPFAAAGQCASVLVPEMDIYPWGIGWCDIIAVSVATTFSAGC